MGFPIPHPQEGESKKLYWNMWYGPDIIRGPSENGHDFYVVEDVLQHVLGSSGAAPSHSKGVRYVSLVIRFRCTISN